MSTLVPRTVIETQFNRQKEKFLLTSYHFSAAALLKSKHTITTKDYFSLIMSPQSRGASYRMYQYVCVGPRGAHKTFQRTTNLI